ncbi:ABC transporter permease [Pseudonocardia sp. DSM 110487]|nr:ABC transporter permease [Pseudonocardia sp. DSM 110487]
MLFLITLFTTAMVDLMPGSPALAMLGDQATPEQIARLDEQLGLDQPFLVRYRDWLAAALGGDLGTSLRMGLPVTTAIAQRFPVTLEIALLSVVMALLIAVPLGLFAGARAGGRLDRAATALSSALLSLPGFAAAVLLIYLLAVKARLFPVGGWVPFTEDPIGNLRFAFLPALSLALMEAAVYFRLLRSDVISTLQEKFVLSARARGLPPGYVLFRHVLRPSLFSLTTVAGLSMGRLLGGAVIVESLFALPGLGFLVIQSVPFQDIPTIQGIVVVVAVIYVLINIVVDVSYSIIDPRIRTR